MNEVLLTHRGWFLLCPIYAGELDGEAPVLVARRKWLGWLMEVSLAIFDAAVIVRECVDPAYEAEFPILLTGRLDIPVLVEDEEC